MEHFGQVHFIGIGGSGMSAIARVLLEMGVKVSGSDLVQKEVTERLASMGARIYIGHGPENLAGADVVVYSTDIPQDNPELVAAKERGLSLYHRSHMLAQILNAKRGVAVAGAHGKTTTSSLIAVMMQHCGLDPTYLIGGEVVGLESNAHFGQGEFVVAEADESDRSFLAYHPSVAVVTNIEADHLENYEGDFSKLCQAYEQFLSQVKPEGLAVLNRDDPHLRELGRRLPVKTLWYALDEEEADLRIADIRAEALGTSGTVWYQGQMAGELRLHLPGRHNLSNAAAALLVGYQAGLDFEPMAQALSTFRGTKRRFEILGRAQDILVVDDYAHHPTEILATLQAAKSTGHRVVALFQPHRYTRTDDLKEEFGRAFGPADEVWIADIYSPKGDQWRPISAEELVHRVRRSSNPNTFYGGDLTQLYQQVLPRLRPGDLVLTMGAGDIWKVGRQLLQNLGS